MRTLLDAWENIVKFMDAHRVKDEPIVHRDVATMGESWEFINIFHPNDAILDDVVKELSEKLRILKEKNPLTDFYLSREYYDKKHIRLGIKKPYSKIDVMEIVREAERKASTMTEEVLSPATERDEVEDMKALAREIAATPGNRLGKIGRLVHVIHHYFNMTDLRLGDGLSDGKETYKRNPEAYTEIRAYLEQAQGLLASLCMEWNRAPSS